MSDFTSDTYGGGNRGTGEWPGSDRTSDDNTRDSNKPGMMDKAKNAMGMGSSGSRDDYDNDRNTSGRGANFDASSNNRSGMTGGDYDSSTTRSGMGSGYDDSTTRSGMGSGYDDSTTRSSTTRSGMGSGYDDSTTRSGMGSGYDDSTTRSGTTTGASTLIDSTLGSTKGYDSFANPNAGPRSMEEFTSGTTGATGLHTSRDTSDTYGSGRTTDTTTYGSGRDTTDTYGSGRDTTDTSTYGSGRDTTDTSRYGSTGTGDYGGERERSSGLSAGAGGDSSTRDLSDRYDATAAGQDDYATGDRKASGRDTYGSSNITTADSYGTGNTGKESFMDKMKDKVGLGSSKDKSDNY